MLTPDGPSPGSSSILRLHLPLVTSRFLGELATLGRGVILLVLKILFKNLRKPIINIIRFHINIIFAFKINVCPSGNIFLYDY